jgi:hypothetical protein
MNKRQAIKILAIILLVATAVTATVVLEVACLTAATTSNSNDLNYGEGTHTVNVLSGPLSVNYKGMTVVGLYVPEDAKNASIHGRFSVTGNGTNHTAMVTVLSGKDFGDWLNGHQFTACYNQDLMPVARGDINVTLSSGPYYIVMESTIYMQSETVDAQIDLTFTGGDTMNTC